MVESDLSPNELGTQFSHLAGERLQLEFVDARGTVVFPPTGLASDSVRAFRARFVAREGIEIEEADLMGLLARVSLTLHWSEAIRLQSFDGEPGFTRAQGQ